VHSFGRFVLSWVIEEPKYVKSCFSVGSVQTLLCPLPTAATASVEDHKSQTSESARVDARHIAKCAIAMPSIRSKDSRKPAPLGNDAAAAILLALVNFLRVDFEVTDDQLDKVIGFSGAGYQLRQNTGATANQT
jgi:hypothetical protein